jgi:hypothetical protein
MTDLVETKKCDRSPTDSSKRWCLPVLLQELEPPKHLQRPPRALLKLQQNSQREPLDDFQHLQNALRQPLDRILVLQEGARQPSDVGLDFEAAAKQAGAHGFSLALPLNQGDYELRQPFRVCSEFQAALIAVRRCKGAYCGVILFLQGST